MDTTDLRAKAESFLALHHAPEILVLTNAWDVATARLLEEAGFPAIATTSAAVAFSLGYTDGQQISREEMLLSVGRIIEHVSVPVTADLEAGYGREPEAVAETVRLAMGVGAVGANIEDNTGDRNDPLIDLTLAAERIAAGREVADKAGVPFVINARTDPYLMRFGETDTQRFDEAVKRANAYLTAGARSAFVPGAVDAETIGRLVQAIDGPVNVMLNPAMPTLPELQELGVARLSTGGGIAAATYGLVRRAAEELKATGTYGFAEGSVSHMEMTKLMMRR